MPHFGAHVFAAREIRRPSYDRAAERVVLETEIVGAVPGDRVFKHDAVAVIGVAADDGQAVVVVGVQLQVLFVDFRDFSTVMTRLLLTIVMCRVFSR